MRFADKGYYIEAYIKCACCGVLVYETDKQDVSTDPKLPVYCSNWCRDWAASREVEEGVIAPESADCKEPVSKPSDFGLAKA